MVFPDVQLLATVLFLPGSAGSRGYTELSRVYGGGSCCRKNIKTRCYNWKLRDPL